MEAKTIAIFGATGRTGKPLLSKALIKYKVKVLVRNPGKLGGVDKNLEIITGNILNQEDVNHAVKDTEAVISVIGQDKNSPYNLQSEGIKNIIAAMKANNINRLITLTGGGVRDKEKDNPGLVGKFFEFMMKNAAGKRVRNILEDGVKHANIVKESGLDWTIVRAPMLNDKPAKNHYEVGNVGSVKGVKLTREDLATFILQELDEDNYNHQLPFITNG